MAGVVNDPSLGGFYSSDVIATQTLGVAGSSSSIDALNDVADVTVTSIAADELLQWNGSAWVNQTIAELGLLETAAIGTTVQAYSAVLAGTTASFTTADETKLDGIEAGADVTDATNVEPLIDTHINVGGAATDSFLKWTGADYSWVTSVPADATTIQGVNVDVSVGTPSDGDILVYRSAGSDFVLEAKPVGGANPAIADVTDITITSAADNEVLAYDSGSLTWINQTAAEAGLATATHTHTLSDITDAGTAAASAATDFVAVAGDTMTGDLNLGDSVKAQFGASNDLQIYHDGTASYIDDAGTGNLEIVAANAIIKGKTSGQWAFAAVDGGATTLYHLGAAKLDTTTTGVDITGNIGVTGTVDGRDIATDGTKLDGIEALADVTDTTNVTAAGALMDSELTDLAGVKALDTSTLATLTGSQTLTNKTLTDPTITGTILEDVYALSGTTPALDPSNGSIQTHTLSGATTYSDSLSAGEAITLMIDDGTANTVTWPTMTWTNNAGSAPTLATTGYTVVALWKVSTTLYGALVGDGT